MRRQIPWKRIIWAALCLVSLLVFWKLCRDDAKTVSYLTPQQAAEDFETEDKPYAMASVFLDDAHAVAQTGVGEIRLSVQHALTAAGVGENPWFYAASYKTAATLKNGIASSDVELTAVAGDFFRIHPMELVSGWYMNESDIMHDRIILDRQSAWDLFYSDNVAGEYLELNGVRYQVAAVVDYEGGKYSALAAGTTRRAWVFADSPGLSASGSSVSSEASASSSGTADQATKTGSSTASASGTASDSAAGFTCIEMVLPQPVKDFAASTLKTALGSAMPKTLAVTDNSARFSLKNRWTVLRHLTTRGISDDGVPYPYWENAARLTENHLAIRLIPEGILLLFPLISLMIVLLWLNHRRTWGLHSIGDAVGNLIDRKYQRDYAAKYRDTAPSGEGLWPEDTDGWTDSPKQRRQARRTEKHDEKVREINRRRALRYAAKRRK